MSNWCQWYRVVKACGGDVPRYIYDQSTRRVNGRTETRNRYIGILGKAEVRSSDSKKRPRVRGAGEIDRQTAGEREALLKWMKFHWEKDAITYRSRSYHVKRTMSGAYYLEPVGWTGKKTDGFAPGTVFVGNSDWVLPGLFDDVLASNSHDYHLVKLEHQQLLPLDDGDEEMVGAHADRPRMTAVKSPRPSGDPSMVNCAALPMLTMGDGTTVRAEIKRLQALSLNESQNTLRCFEELLERDELSNVSLESMMRNLDHIASHARDMQVLRPLQVLRDTIAQYHDSTLGESFDKQVTIMPGKRDAQGDPMLVDLHAGDGRFSTDGFNILLALDGYPKSSSVMTMPIKNLELYKRALTATMRCELPRRKLLESDKEIALWEARVQGRELCGICEAKPARVGGLCQSCAADIPF